MKPNKPLLRKWVAALRSGKYHQTSGALCRVENRQTFHCCLGVACRVAAKNGFKVTTLVERGGDNEVTFSYNGYSDGGVLPDTLRDKLGISLHVQSTLVRMNDGDRTFKEIADFIEEEYDL